MHEHHHRFRALGSDCLVRVVVEDPARGPELVAEAVTRLDDLEARWSRFRPGSELNRLNAHTGDPVFTSPDTAALVALAIEAWRATGGRFDPTVLDALVEAGYDRSFEELPDSTAPAPGARRGAVVPGPAGVEVDERIGLVVLPPGCHLDLGGIGKGRCADLVTEQLLDAGAAGVCVDLGGDVRVAGATAAGGDDWVVAVDDPFHPGDDLALVRLAGGSVTTSSRARRRWGHGADAAHHLIDPSTGRPAASGLTAVTVVAGSAAWGEAHAKAALVAGPARGRALVDGAGMAALLVTDAGEVLTVGPLEAYLVEGTGP